MTRKDLQGWTIIAFVVLSLGLLIFAWHALNASADNYDRQTLCRINANDPSLLLLIDKTDPWGEKERRRLRELIEKLKQQLRRHERLAIYMLDETGTFSLAPLFEMCNPGTGRQANALYENARLMEQRFNEQFAAPLDKVLQTLLHPGTATRSPLLNAIGEIRGSKEERLIVISDMMEYSDELSFYQEVPTDQQEIDRVCRFVTSPYESIQVYYINRAAVAVSRKQEVRTFWYRCFKHLAWESDWKAL